MARERKDVVQFRWQAEGKPDPQPEIAEYKREDLALADFSDDELANYADMHGNRSDAEEFRVMMDLLNPDSVHLPRSAILTAVKDRIKWLSRQLAIAQGTYPGQEKAPTQEEVTQALLRSPMPENMDDLLELSGQVESRSAGKSLLPGIDLKASLRKHDFAPHNIRCNNLWEDNIDHFYQITKTRRHDLMDHVKFNKLIEDFTKQYGQYLEGINLRLALGVNPVERDRNHIHRWEEYVKLANRLMEHQALYIPFDGDCIAKSRGDDRAILTKSRWHASGQFVDHPVGQIEDRMATRNHILRQYGHSNVAEQERRMMGHALGDLDALLEGSKDAIDPQTGKPYDVVVIGGGGESIFGSGKTAREVLAGAKKVDLFVGVPEDLLTLEEQANPHSFWHPELNELIARLGLNQIMFNPAQAQSRILRLAKDLDIDVIQKALGRTKLYVDRLIALRKVRKAVDEGIAESQKKVEELFGNEAAETAQELLKVPEHRMPLKDSVVIKNTTEFKKKGD